MRIAYSPALIIMMFFLASCTDTTRHPVVNEKENARVFVQQFYDWYNKLYNGGVSGTGNVSTDVYTIKHRPQYFDTRLLGKFNEYYAAEPKNADEIVGLDFDPILGAQDDGFDYKTGAVKQLGNKFFVDIHCGLQGKTRDSILATPTHIVAEVTKNRGEWQFANFLYPPPEGNGNNLVALLEQCKLEAEQYVSSHKNKK